MRTRIAGGLFVSHLRSETDLKSHDKKVRIKISNLRYITGILQITSEARQSFKTIVLLHFFILSQTVLLTNQRILDNLVLD